MIATIAPIAATVLVTAIIAALLAYPSLGEDEAARYDKLPPED